MDFRLKVFIEVARYLSFTKAAKELCISQPAISKHIQELESMYKVQLFERNGVKISLTHEGGIFLKHAREIVEKYDFLRHEMELLSSSCSGELRIGADATMAQYFISPLIADFIVRFPHVKITVLTGSPEQIENALEMHRIDMGLVEGSRRRPDLRYAAFVSDELVLVTGALNKCPDRIAVTRDSREEGTPLLTDLPLVLRETGSGTVQVIETALARHGLKLSDLNILLQMDTTEGIKRFLLNSPDSFAIVSVISVLKELKQHELRIIGAEELEMKREFAFVSLPENYNGRIEKFVNFARFRYPELCPVHLPV